MAIPDPDVRPKVSPAAALLFGLLTLLSGSGRADDWAQWLGPQRDSVWRESGIVGRFPATGLPISWRVSIGSGYSAPAISRGRVFLTDRVTGAPADEPRGERGRAEGRERVWCFDEASGVPLWHQDYQCSYKFGYPSGPRAMPLVDGDRVITVGADGHLQSRDTANGRLLWSKHYPTDYGIPTQTWGVASSPLVEGDQLIALVGGTGSTVVAWDKRTGEERWRVLNTREPGYSSPIVIEAGGARQLIVWDSEAVNSLDPATGRSFWRIPFPTKMAHSIGTPRRQGNRLFVSSFFDGSLMIELDDRKPTARELWRMKGRDENHPEGLQSLMSTPFLDGEVLYGVCGYGQLRCLRSRTGERIWESLVPTTADLKPARWTTAFLVRQGERYFIWNERGDLILADLSADGYREISRQHLLDPTNLAGSRPVVWSHPSFANGHVLVRNDLELVRVDLREDRPGNISKRKH